MCTAAFYKTNSAYFGRTLDYEFSYGDEVTLTPRNFPLPFREMGTLRSHYAILGMAHVSSGHPLYYDAMNEKGLGMAGLNFVGNACYGKSQPGKDNIAQFEFIVWILGQCATVREARELLARVNRERRDEIILTIEPHLTVFTGLEALQGEALVHHESYPDSRSAFHAACAALKTILANIDQEA